MMEDPLGHLLFDDPLGYLLLEVLAEDQEGGIVEEKCHLVSSSDKNKILIIFYYNKI